MVLPTNNLGVVHAKHELQGLTRTLSTNEKAQTREQTGVGLQAAGPWHAAT